MMAHSKYSPIELPLHLNYSYKLSEYEKIPINAQLKNLSISDMARIFSDNPVDEESIDERLIYCIHPKPDENKKKKSKNSGISEKNTKSSSSTKGQTSPKLIKKKRGRKPLKNTPLIHDKNRSDNLLRKIQAHYLKFIIAFSNEILKKFWFKETFYKISYKYIKNIKISSFYKEHKGLKISDIICRNITPRYKSQDIKANIILYEKIKENEILQNIFSQNFFSMFKGVYFESIYTINIANFGPITLSKNKVKMFDQLLKNNCRDLDEEHGEKLKSFAEEYYLKGE